VPFLYSSRMFIREKKFANQTKSSIQIVENQRIGHTTKQRVIRHVGTAHTPDEIQQLKLIALVLKDEFENKRITSHGKKSHPHFAASVGDLGVTATNDLVDISKIREIARRTLGIHDVYGYLYDRLGFGNLFSRPKQREESARLLREIVLARIAHPVSKRASVAMLDENFGVSLDLDHVYQMMDKMDDHFIERLQLRTQTETLKLTGEKLSVLFYDATTLYFESFSEDELKQNGYSKDLKFNQPQVLLALFVTEGGLPIGYELFPGATFEGHTLVTVLEKLKSRYQLKDIVFVADRGLFSEDNLKLLEEKKLKYIVGARIKNMSKKLTDDILNADNYKPIELSHHQLKKSEGKIQQRVAIFDYTETRKLVVHYSSKRAFKDAADRDKSIEKLRKKLKKSKDPKSLLSSYGYKKFLDIKGKAEIIVNEDKIKEASVWDGLVGLVTNYHDANAEQLFRYYRGLWQIEESFRINKHDLKMRPIYHWSPHRVKAHIAICFMSFVCVRHLEYLVATQIAKLSPEVIRHTLLHVQASIIEDTLSKKTWILPSMISTDAKRIYQILGIKIPLGVTAIKCGA